MSKNFNLKVSTPNGMVVETKDVSNLSLETSAGQITILPEHINYTSILGIGILQYTLADGSSGTPFVISNGFVNFTDDSVIVLTDSVDFKADLDEQAVNKSLSAANQELAAKNLHLTDARHLQDQHARLLAQLELLRA